MIPHSIIFAAMAASIFFATTSWGARQKSRTEMSNEHSAAIPAFTVRGDYLHFLRPDGKEHAIGTYESPDDLRRVAAYNLAAASYVELEDGQADR